MSLLIATVRQDTPAYWQSLGRFIQRFAQAETVAHLSLGALIDRDARIAGAVIPSRVSLSETLSAIDRLVALRFTRADSIEAMRDVTAKMREIAQLRNNLLHNGTTFTDLGPTIVKIREAHQQGKAAEPHCVLSPEILDALATDCHRAGNFFWIVLHFYADIALLNEDKNISLTAPPKWSFSRDMVARPNVQPPLL